MNALSLHLVFSDIKIAFNALQNEEILFKNICEFGKINKILNYKSILKQKP